MSTYSATTGGVTKSEEACRRFSLAEIQSATHNFDDALVVGIGGFGKVYKGLLVVGIGELADSATVAIKRLNEGSQQGAEEFWTEVELLSKLRHNHLVALLGYCNDCQEMILVYEYISRGNLADHLYKKSKDHEHKQAADSSSAGGSNSHHLLTWEQRLNICIGAVRGLDYLHIGSCRSFIHRDVKTANILLDEKWEAKISDFGLSKGTTSHSVTHLITNVKGTFGYLDPDYFQTRRLTKKSDVYAFGVVLFEVLCGRPAVDSRLEEDQISLASWVQLCMKNRQVDRIIDPSLRGQISPHSLKTFSEIASKCLHRLPRERPSMAALVGSLELALASQLKGSPDGIITKVFQGSWRRERKKDNNDSDDQGFSIQVPAVTLRELQKEFTPDRGTYARVYYAKLSYGKAVAVKSLEFPAGPKPNADFFTHVSMVSRLKHENLVELLGYCNQRFLRLLVYEFATKGSLHDILHGEKTPRRHEWREVPRVMTRSNLLNYLNLSGKGVDKWREPWPVLTWKQRLRIAIDAGRGLEYLHEKVQPCVVHRNIQSSNVLLFKDFKAKIADINHPKRDDYMDESDYYYRAPEYTTLAGHYLTPKMDVYSFGVVLLELLTGRKPFIYARPSEQRSLVVWAKQSLKDDLADKLFRKNWSSEDRVFDKVFTKRVVDPKLEGRFTPKSVAKVAAVALSCVEDEAESRPDMSTVVKALETASQLDSLYIY